GLRRAGAAQTSRLDFGEMGHFGKQSTRKVLLDHQSRPETARYRNGELAAYRWSYQSRVGSREPGLMVMRDRLRALFSGLFGLLTNEREERDFNQEIETHLRMLEERFIAEGLGRDEARFAAKRAFGRVLRIKELRRKEHTLAFMDVFLQEFRYARRTLTRSPAFSFVVILSLALGIAANTTIFSIINGTLLSPLIVDVDRVVSISTFSLEQREIP